MRARTWAGGACPRCGRTSMERDAVCRGRFRGGQWKGHEPTHMESRTFEVPDHPTPVPARWPSGYRG